ncbi:phage tail protein [Shewanella surugensis]|uniref:Phage tail protein n=1 Tax=Shewanella surugensis TaxID=212020 RepID=A0ABT0L685_9GAMM|nr:phage tail protein [Shewanella surugensis]MCL1123199.1 phage tail protein [Shewanella surugensis]
MATTVADIENDYPIPVYRFRVSITGDESNSIAFSEVSGLDIGVETITYKDGFGKKHMPGQPTDVNITLKRGLVRTKSMFFDWLSSIRLNKVEKQDITVVLVDDTDADLVIWTVKNAFPKKLTAPSFNGGSNEASVESLELMADDISIEFK